MVSRADERAAKPSPPDPSDLPLHRRRRRDQILRAAFALLDEREYDEIQMREVAGAADVSLGTIYRYFASKEHLYAAALLEWSTDFDPEDAALIPGDTDEERIRALLRRAIDAFARRPQVLRAEVALEGSTDPNVLRLFDEFADRHLAVMRRAVRDVDPADGRAIVDALSAVLGARSRSWALGRSSLGEVRRTLDRSVDLVFHGVVATGGLGVGRRGNDPLPGPRGPERGAPPMSTDSKVTKDLMQTLADGRDGFAAAAGRLADSDQADLAATMQGFSQQRATFHAELETLAAGYGDDVDEDGSLAAAAHRGWMAVKDALSGSDAAGVLDAAEQGEDHAVSEYRKALNEDLSAELRTVVQRQCTEVESTHDQVRALRNAVG